MSFAGFDHVDLRVHSLAAVQPLYDALLPALGLADIHLSDGVREYYEASAPGRLRRFFGLNELPGHAGDASRVCFSAATPADVDRLAAIAVAAGALVVEGPEIPYSSEKYYAVFFEDASGNKLEIAYRRPHAEAVAKPDALEAD
jgi:catechol 2,3-dioxygenase-like lactoylglutathione lyase family enzyme